MIDLTPLDVRKKRGDFIRGFRGYDPQQVDSFLELVAERLEELVKENLTLRERADRLAEQVTSQTGRERAVHEALVTAQQLREEIHATADKEAELVLRDARAKGERLLADAERKAGELAESLHELDRRRRRFLQSFRNLLERELDAVSVEEGREVLEGSVAIDLELGGGRPVGLAPRPSDDVHALAGGSEEDLGGEEPSGAAFEAIPEGGELEFPAMPAEPIETGSGGDRAGEAKEAPGGTGSAQSLWMPNFPAKRATGQGGEEAS